MANTFKQVREAEELLKVSKKCIILVVDGSKHAASVAHGLRENKTIKGTHIVIETTPIPTTEYLMVVMDNARAWISRNSLKRLDGGEVKVIWVVDKELPDYCSAKEVIENVFKNHENFVLKVKIYDNRITIGPLDSNTEETVQLDNPDQLLVHCAHAVMNTKASVIKTEVIGQHPNKLRVWDSEKVILFGRTGSGKSTVAQMLTLGKISNESEFQSGSDAVGVTKEVKIGEGRGWHVTDTPGFGETANGSVSTDKAVRKMIKLVKEICGVYSHFVYVYKWDRLSKYDGNVWAFFRNIFKDAEANFTIIVTGKSENLSLEDINVLKGIFTGCESFISVDFCPKDDDSDIEEENIEARNESLEMLEKNLASLGRRDVVCTEGKLSKGRSAYSRGKANVEIGGGNGDIADFVSDIFHKILVVPCVTLKGMMRKSEIDENLLLLPQ